MPKKPAPTAARGTRLPSILNPRSCRNVRCSGFWGVLVQPHLTVGFNTGNEVSGWTVTTTDEADVPTGVFYLRRAPVIGVVGRVPTSLTLTPLSLFFSLIAIASILPVVPLRLAGTNIRRCNRARTTPTPELNDTDQTSIACELEIHEMHPDCETELPTGPRRSSAGTF